MERLLETYAPRARQEDLVIEGLDGETLVYDMRTHKAHCLNPTAALVWNRCDGRATVGEMRAALEKEGGLSRVYSGIRREKTIDFVLSRATIAGE